MEVAIIFIIETQTIFLLNSTRYICAKRHLSKRKRTIFLYPISEILTNADGSKSQRINSRQYFCL